MKQHLLAKQCHWQHVVFHEHRCHSHLETPVLVWHGCLQGSKSSEQDWFPKALAANAHCTAAACTSSELAEHNGIPAHNVWQFSCLSQVVS